MGSKALELSPLQCYLEQLHAEMLELNSGEVANYIPELTRADPAWFGTALVSVDGEVYQAGDSRQAFTVQSISKAVTYGLALEDRGLELYFRQCSMLVTARDLAMMAACLANNGVNPVTGVVALKSRYVEKVLSVMSTCGMYDYSGAWIFNVGMPAKSGVGDGIMAVLPGQCRWTATRATRSA